jgi:sec-independent protein translocase protein TatA
MSAFPSTQACFCLVARLSLGQREDASAAFRPGGVRWDEAMGSFSIWHWMLFGAVALLLFGGKGKISDLMGDVAKGVKSFKKGLADDDEPTVAQSTPRPLESRVSVDANDVHKVS